MSLIKFSTPSIARVVQSGVGSVGGFAGNKNILTIYKGAIPTKGSLNNAKTPKTFRASDILVEFDNIPLYTGIDGSFQMRSTVFSKAKQSGAATWFMLHNGAQHSSFICIVGDVTLPNKGGAIEVPNTNIFVNQTYQLGIISFNIPSTYVY